MNAKASIPQGGKQLPRFHDFRLAVNNSKKVKPYVGCVLALDPGETTGWALFEASVDETVLLRAGQIKTWPMAVGVPELQSMISSHFGHIVFERYAVYEWKSDEHSWSTVPTLHVIGAVETLCIQNSLPYSEQTAQIAKNFCTDKLLTAWDLYLPGLRHARDAIRHGTYFLMFGAKCP